jgi:hypothetical protein
MKGMRITIALLWGSLLCAPRVCEGVIAYSWVSQGMYTGGEPIGYDLDFNGDAIFDLIFQSDGMLFGVAPPEDNRVIASGGEVHALLESFNIGPDVDPDLWQQGQFGLMINACAVFPEGPVCLGQFRQTTAYMGVMFNIEDAVHYGWVRISNPFDGTGGTIMDFAYETEPGVGILAGAGMIPEPATSALMTVGGLLLAFRRKKT